MLAEKLTKYINENLSDVFLKTKDTVDLRFEGIIEENIDYIVVEFTGGLNGNGDWINYLSAITELVTILNTNYKSWLVNLNNDCLDDIFYLTLGIKEK